MNSVMCHIHLLVVSIVISSYLTGSEAKYAKGIIDTREVSLACDLAYKITYVLGLSSL